MVPSLSLKEKVLKKSHDSLVAGHPDFFKTYKMLREILSYKGLKADIMKYVNESPTCQQNKVEHTRPAGLLHSFPIPGQKWESISMDFITSLSKVLGKDCIFVVVDRLTNLLIYLLLLPISLVHKWLNYSLRNFSNCMGFLRVLLVTEIIDF